MPTDRVTITQMSNGNWVVRYGNRSYNHGPGASGRAHAQRQVAAIYANKNKRRQRQGRNTQKRERTSSAFQRP